ncbi:MAG: GNAT family N-acetyltransferase [Bdellovibrionales bacterium]|nr:GNAT family N-acetyltransferase [Bdellovibrionales bacterium]
MQFSVYKSSFQQVFPLWREELWPGRQSEILPTSSMVFGGGYDLAYHKAIPQFWMAKDEEGNLLGVNSGFKTGKGYRSRGLYVRESYRRHGVGSLLLQKTIAQAHEEDCEFVWSLPRESALQVYLSVGFEIASDKISEGVEFGPNFYVRLKINPVENEIDE